MIKQREAISEWLQDDGYSKEEADAQSKESKISIIPEVTKIEYENGEFDLVVFKDGKIVKHYH